MKDIDINKIKDKNGFSAWEITFTHFAGYVTGMIYPHFNIEIGDYLNEGGYDVIHLGREEIRTFICEKLYDVKVEYDYEDDAKIDVTAELKYLWKSEITDYVNNNIDYYYKLW